MSDNVLITGASGFVGGALVRRLAGPNHWPGVVRMALRRPDPRLPAAVESAILGEFTSETDWRAALQGVQCVIHLAGRAHILRDTAVDPLAEYRRVNVDATRNLARQAAANGVARLVFMSTIKVNGEVTAPGSAFREDDSQMHLPAVFDPYSRSKLEAELSLCAIGLQSGMEIVIIRPPLIYGPGVKANFAALVRAVARGIPLPLGAVKNARSLIGLDNLVDFVTTCITHPAAANEIFLVSDGEDLTTTEIIRRIGDALGRPARLIAVPRWLLLSGATIFGRRDMARRLLDSLRVDSRKARTLLGWTPPISVDEGLRRAVAPLRRDRRS